MSSHHPKQSLGRILYIRLAPSFETTPADGLETEWLQLIPIHSSRVIVMRTIIQGTIAGLVIGICWSQAISAASSSGMVYGFFIGAVGGLLIYLAQRMVSARFHIRKAKTYEMAGKLIGISLLVGVVSAVIVLAIRILF